MRSRPERLADAGTNETGAARESPLEGAAETAAGIDAPPIPARARSGFAVGVAAQAPINDTIDANGTAAFATAAPSRARIIGTSGSSRRNACNAPRGRVRTA